MTQNAAWQGWINETVYPQADDPWAVEVWPFSSESQSPKLGSHGPDSCCESFLVRCDDCLGILNI